jgi:hypothetical protein
MPIVLRARVGRAPNFPKNVEMAHKQRTETRMTVPGANKMPIASRRQPSTSGVVRTQRHAATPRPPGDLARRERGKHRFLRHWRPVPRAQVIELAAVYEAYKYREIHASGRVPVRVRPRVGDMTGTS